MRFEKKYVLAIIGSFLCGLAFSIKDNVHYNTQSASVECSVCFTPGNPCTQKIVDKIEHAKKEILVQSYSFTSIEIGNALIRAHQRGVKVKMIVDSSQEGKLLITQLAHAGIPMFIDKPAGIAHNKVMIIDEQIVLTGSFNFTKAAQNRNVENSICIISKKIAAQYRKQWKERLTISYSYKPNMSQVEEAEISFAKSPKKIVQIRHV